MGKGEHALVANPLKCFAPITAPLLLLCFAWTNFTSCCTADVVVTSAQFCVRWCLPVAAAQSRPAMKAMEQALGTVLKGHSGGKESLHSKQKHRGAFIYLKNPNAFCLCQISGNKASQGKSSIRGATPLLLFYYYFIYYARQRARKTNST